MTQEVRLMAHWPVGSCPECYEAGTPERPFCGQHAHDLTTTGVTLCEPHRHVARDLGGDPVRLSATRHTEGDPT